jgi:ADP-ribosylglycohydrolase
LAVDGVVFDVGATTSEAIEALQSGTPPLKAGPARERDNGNGALMRVLPLALWHRGTDRELVKDAQLQSRVTHGHLRSQVCCALYCLWARRVLHGVEGAWSEAVATLRDLYLADPEALEELERSIQPEAPYRVTGSGYVVDCLHSARTAFEATSYLGVVRSAIALGNDTDTTACVAGGLAGLRHGIGGIPTRFREALRGSDIYEPLLQRLLEHVA